MAMKITGISMGFLRTPLKTPFKTAVRSVSEMTDVIVRVETKSGLYGWGSAPPTAKVTGDTGGAITGAIAEELRPALIGADALDLEGCLDILKNSLPENTSAKAALDIALHDLWARSMGQPAWKLFGGNGREIRTDVTVSVKAIREAVGKEVKIRIDANQGWRAREAVQILERMHNAELGIELVEQPVKSHDIEGMIFVTAHSPIPVVADESCKSPADAIRLLDLRAADMVNIKLMKCGGVGPARQIIAASRTFGAEVMFGSMLEGKVSAAAAVHLSSACHCVTRVDIDGPVLCSADPVLGGPVFDGPRIKVSVSPGFGIDEVPGVEWLNL